MMSSNQAQLLVAKNNLEYLHFFSLPEAHHNYPREIPASLTLGHGERIFLISSLDRHSQRFKILIQDLQMFSLGYLRIASVQVKQSSMSQNYTNIFGFYSDSCNPLDGLRFSSFRQYIAWKKIKFIHMCCTIMQIKDNKITIISWHYRRCILQS